MRLAILAPPALMTTAFYGAWFMTTGVHMPFWPLWLDRWGLTASEIGMFTALGIGVRIVAGLAVPSLADRLDRRRLTLVACLLVAAILFVAHLWIDAKATLLLATLGVGVAFAGIGPLAEALGVAASRAYDFPYAQTRGLGSIGFLAANLIVGASIARIGVDLALWWIVGCLCVATLLALRHPGGGRAEGQAPPRYREIGVLLVDPVFAIFVAAVAFSQSGHAIFFSLGSVHWARLGVSDQTIGGLWAMSVATEIVFMVFFGSWAIRKLGPAGAIAASAATGVFRWTVMAFDPAPWALWPLQALHASTFGLGHLGAMAFIAEAVPARFGAAAQGAMGSMAVGLLLALGMAAAAATYPWLGGGVYGIGAILAAVGFCFAYLLSRRWKGGTLEA